jgi:hypothetical protein
MTSLVRGGGWLPLKALALVLGAWIFHDSSVVAGGDGCAGPGPWSPVGPGSGTLGYGPPGLYPGFQGFGLGYHLGYGYGGDALGVGVDGGYPFYGGPGYPHCEPPLRRLGRIAPFPYYGGPGYPTPDHPNFFGGTGPLVPDKPVITIGSDRGDLGYASGYGPFMGTLPYPESFLAPFTSRAAAAGSSSGVSTPNPSPIAPDTAPAGGPGRPSATPPPASGAITPLPPQGRSLGIDAEPAVDAGGVRGVRVSKVDPGTAAEKAGLQAGDVIHSLNGYRTDQPGNLAWIIAHAAPDRVLKMSVRTASDGKERAITVQLP